MTNMTTNAGDRLIPPIQYDIPLKIETLCYVAHHYNAQEHVLHFQWLGQ